MCDYQHTWNFQKTGPNAGQTKCSHRHDCLRYERFKFTPRQKTKQFLDSSQPRVAWMKEIADQIFADVDSEDCRSTQRRLHHIARETAELQRRCVSSIEQLEAVVDPSVFVLDEVRSLRWCFYKKSVILSTFFNIPSDVSIIAMCENRLKESPSFIGWPRVLCSIENVVTHCYRNGFCKKCNRIWITQELQWRKSTATDTGRHGMAWHPAKYMSGV